MMRCSCFVNIPGQLAAVLLGLLGGAMVLIALALVPYWQSLPALEFAQWFAANSHFIAAVMLPLAMAAGLLTLVATALAWRARHPARYEWGVAAVCVLISILMFPLYFRETNAAFAGGFMAAPEITAELVRWQWMHWIRTFAALAACCCAVAAIRPTRAES